MSREEIVPEFTLSVPVSSLDSRPAPSFEVFVSKVGQVHVDVIGELDVATVPVLASRLRDIEPDCDLAMDIALVTFVDSTALGLLATEHKRLLAHGHSFTIKGPSPSVQRIFAITGLDQLFTIEQA